MLDNRRSATVLVTPTAPLSTPLLKGAGGMADSDSTSLKICGKCREPKPVEMFARSIASKDGRNSVCRACDSDRQGRRYAGLSDVEKAALRARPRLNVWPRSKTDAYMRQQRTSARAYQKRFPKKVAARNAVAYALRTGRLTRKPCEVCGSLRTSVWASRRL